MYPVLLKIGPFALYSLWIAVAFALILGTLLFLKNAKYQRMDLSFLVEHSLSLLLGTLIGSKFIFFLGNWGYYGQLQFISALKQIFFFWQPGFSFWGGVIGFVLVFLWHSYRKEQKPLEWLEITWPPFLMGIMIGNVGQLLDGQGYGRETTMPWGITFESTNVIYTVPIHPTQIYSILLILGILLSKKTVLERWPILKEDHHWTLMGITVYSLGRLIIEFFRGDETLEFFGIRIGYIVSFMVFVPMAYFMYKKLKTS